MLHLILIVVFSCVRQHSDHQTVCTARLSGRDGKSEERPLQTGDTADQAAHHTPECCQQGWSVIPRLICSILPPISLFHLAGHFLSNADLLSEDKMMDVCVCVYPLGLVYSEIVLF